MHDWKSIQLGDLCDSARGITYGIVKVGVYVPGGVPVIRGGDIRQNRIVFSEQKRVSAEVSNQFKRTILRGAEIVLNLIAEPGHSAVVPPSMAGYNVSRDVAVIPLIDQINRSFVNHFLRSPIAIDWLYARLQGSVTQKINLGTLRQIPVPIPPAAYQDAVAAALDALDGKIGVNDQIMTSASDLITAHYGRALDIFKLPLTLSEAVEFDFGAPFSSDHFNSQRQGLPLIRIRDLKTCQPGLWTTERLRGDVLVQPGDVVAGMDAEFRPGFWLGRSAILNQRVLRGRSRVPGGEESFVREVLRGPLGEIERHKVGTTVIHLNKRDLSTSRIHIPPARALLEFEALADPLRRRIISAAHESGKLTELRNVLLPGLMSGEIRVREAERVVGDAT